MADETTTNGGQTALAGYMYQIVGVLAMKALAEDPNPTEVLPDRLAELVQLVRRRLLYHEYLEEDAVLELPQENAPSEWALIQFKFSRTQPPAKILPGKFKEMLERLCVSAKRIGCFDSDKTQYMLVTNREYSPGTQKILDNVLGSDLGDDEKCIASKLVLVGGPSISSWKDALTKYACGLGCFDAEITAGIHTLIGSLVDRVANAGEPRILRSDLLQAFVQDTKARHLTVETLATYSSRKLEAAKPILRVPDMPIRRSILDNITQSLHGDGTSVVVLRGRGGNGKTIALWEWVRERLTTYTSSDTSPFIVIVAPNRLERPLPAKVVAAAGGLAPSHPRERESYDYTFRRLRIANSTLPRPSLIIGLDDIDDHTVHGEQRNEVDNLLHWCWEQGQDADGNSLVAPVALVVTCRPGEERAILSVWPGRSGNLTGSHMRLKIFDVSDFSDDELLQASSVALHSPVASRIQRTITSRLRGVSGSTRSEPLISFEGEDRQARLVHPDVLEAIAHPPMWNAFVSLPNLEEQHRVLDGDSDALRSLTTSFVSTFYEKATVSTQATPFNRAVLEGVIPQIAGGTVDSKQPYKNWFDIANPLIGPPQAERLFNEAESGGLINLDSPEWYWRHPFVRQHLAELQLATGGR